MIKGMHTLRGAKLVSGPASELWQPAGELRGGTL